eukprot:snap_masked-scaffold_15-processed-gene-2.62-mRNA-1 protein AED:1.00 eAED:1.00 QI:0/-1/0/0/-1/1/1/0/76
MNKPLYSPGLSAEVVGELQHYLHEVGEIEGQMGEKQQTKASKSKCPIFSILIIGVMFSTIIAALFSYYGGFSLLHP